MHIFLLVFLVMFAACAGSAGDAGSMGIEGPVGPAGAVGPQGPAGPMGAVGPQGPAGLQGPQGVPGAAGAVGSSGPQGPQGTPGSAGAVGPAGPQGPQGPQGFTGATGSQGVPGPAGPMGPAGPAGASAIVYAADGSRLGLLVSAAPGQQTYVTYGDTFTNAPDGYVVSLAAAQVWYVNNDCTGAAYVDHQTYLAMLDRIYVGTRDTLYIATVGAPANVAMGSWNRGGGVMCTASSTGISGHRLQTIATPTNLTGSLPWHVEIE